MKSSLLCVVASILLLSLSGCGDTPEIVGKWQLVEYCYGTDCAILVDHDMLQVWDFTDKKAGEYGRGCYWGNVYQDSLMNDQIVWSLNADGDSLYVSKPDGGCSDYFYITEMCHDTMVLSVMMNNILVRQRFVRI